MAEYESEHTKFMRELMAARPQLENEQQKSRAIWWDKKPDLDQERRNKASGVKMQAYVYQNKV